MPKLWTESIDAHRHAVRDAILRTTAQLAQSDGPRAVTMSRIAEETGIGRATLYKYFADVEAIMLAWHERQIAGHLQQLTEASQRGATAAERLKDVLTAYALISQENRGHHDGELASVLHRDDAHVAHAERALRTLVRHVLVDGVTAGLVRDDVPADELVTFCLHALDAAGDLRSKAAVRRLVELTLGAIGPPIS